MIWHPVTFYSYVWNNEKRKDDICEYTLAINILLLYFRKLAIEVVVIIRRDVSSFTDRYLQSMKISIIQTAKLQSDFQDELSETISHTKTY